MSRKLFYVEITKSGWVIADNEIQAQAFEEDILNNEIYTAIKVTPYDQVVLMESGWDKTCYVYHKAQKNIDITLGDALK